MYKRQPLGDTFEVWADAFITGKKSTDTDWDAYVAEMKNLSIDPVSYTHLLRQLRHGICVAKMLDNVGLRYPHRASGAKAPDVYKRQAWV